MTAASADAVFAQRLREIRTQALITQRQLAERMTAAGHKVYQSTIGKIEVGDRTASVGEAVALASILGVGLTALTGEPDPDAGTQARIQNLRYLVARRQEEVLAARALYDDAAERLADAEARMDGTQ